MYEGGELEEGCEECEQKEVVKMTVSGTRITWSVKGDTRAEICNSMIGNKSINWVPFIKMCNQKDKIRWV